MKTGKGERKVKGAAQTTLETDAERRSLLASIIDSFEDAVISKTPDGMITSWNPAAERMFGYKAEEVIGKPVTILESPERQGEMAEILGKIRNGERIEHYETSRRRKDGGLIYVSLTVSPIYDSTGRLIGVSSIKRDITERMRVEIRYRRVFETTGDGILILNADTGEIVDVNPMLVELLGYSEEDLRGKTLWDIGALADVAASKASFMELQQKEHLRYEDLPLLTKDGRRIYVEFISNVYPTDGIKLVQCNIRDITARKKAEESLAISETRHRRLFETTKDGILILDADTGQITDVNPFLAEMLGYPGEELLGKRLWEIGAFKDVAASRAAYSELQQKKYIRYEDLPLETREGRRIDVEFVSNVYAIGLKKVIQCNIRDITARKRAEQEREQTLLQLEAVLDNINDGVVIADLEGKVLAMNKEALALHGLKSSGQLSEYQDSFEMFDLEGEPLPFEQWPLHRALRGERFVDYQVRLRQKETGRSWIASYTGTLVHDKAGKAILAVITLRDVTERKRLEEALKISETRYRRLFETTGDGILILNADTGQIMDVNPLLVWLLGYSDEDFLGKKLWDIGAWSDVAASKAGFSELQHEEYIRYEDLPLLTKNGRRIYVEFISNVYPIDGTKLIQCNIRDITDRKQAQEEIARLNDDLAAHAAELESVNRELEAFNYAVAHDLRKPLTAVNGYCQIMQETCGDKLDEQCRGYLQEAYQGTLRMNQLIDTLLRFSSLTRVEPKRETVALDALAHEVAIEMQLAEPERRVEFRIAQGMTVDGDANLLRVVLENLLGNAWKYTATQQVQTIEFGATRIDGQPVYYVRDNGTGFDMADAEKLFVAFQRLPGAEEFKGFGIGLATVERIVRRHGGKVWAEGEPGKGATFYFTLPADAVSVKLEQRKGARHEDTDS